MRIAYLVSEYPHIRHTYLLREIRGLRSLGFEIKVIAVRPDLRSPADYTSEEQDEFANAHYILKSSTVKLLWAQVHTLLTRPAGYARGLAAAFRYGRLHPRRTMYGLFYLAEAVASGRWIELQKLPHVHTHYASTVAWIMASVFRIPVSMTIHGSGEFEDPIGFRLREKIAASEFVITISNFGRSELMRSAPDSEWRKIEVCRLGVELLRFSPRPFRPDPQPFELLCVGGIAPPRSFEMLIRAMAQLERDGRDALLRLVGDGPDRPALERLANELGVEHRVNFEGWKNQDQLRALYHRADLFVFSSLAEGIPVALMEAMAMEIPCVVSRVSGIPELVRDGLDGLLVAVSDEQAIVRALTHLMDDQNLRRLMGESARKHIAAEYNLKNNLEQLAHIFSRRLAR